MASYWDLPKRCVFLSQSLPVRGAVDRGEERPRAAHRSPCVGHWSGTSFVPGFLCVHEQIEGGNFARGRRQDSSALVLDRRRPRSRPRPAAEESLLGDGPSCWRFAETCIRTSASSEAIFFVLYGEVYLILKVFSCSHRCRRMPLL